jgi:hypothetical protein
MSYLIQNTYSFLPTTKISVRTRSAFISRAFPAVLTCLYMNTEAFTIPTSLTPYQRLVLLNSTHFFTKFYNVLFPNPKLLRFVPFGINFPVSAHYNALSNINSQLSSKSSLTPLLNPTHRSFSYPYFSRPQIVITNVSKSPFSLALQKLLRLSLGVWFVWPRGYKLNMNYTDIGNTWYLLRFLNKYFFKVYSV